MKEYLVKLDNNPDISILVDKEVYYFIKYTVGKVKEYLNPKYKDGRRIQITFGDSRPASLPSIFFESKVTKRIARIETGMIRPGVYDYRMSNIKVDDVRLDDYVKEIYDNNVSIFTKWFG